MTLTQQIADYSRRPQRAAEADGLNDITGGIAIFAITLMEYASTLSQASMQGREFWTTLAFQAAFSLWILSVVGMFAVIILSKRYAKSLRERFVYPRLGYVAQPAAPSLRRKLIGVGIALLFVVVLTRVLPPGSSSSLWSSGTMILALGTLGALSYFYHFDKLGFVRHLALGGVSLLISLVLANLHLEPLPALGCYAIAMSVSMILAGAIAFAKLLRAPVIGEDEAE